MPVTVTGSDAEAYVFPRNTSSANVDLNNFRTINARFIRLIFRSDSGVNRSGWDLDIASATFIPAEPEVLLPSEDVGNRLYLDKNDYTKVSETGDATSVGVGFIAGRNVENNSIYALFRFSVYDGSIGPRGPIGPPGPTGTGLRGATGATGNPGRTGSASIDANSSVWEIKRNSDPIPVELEQGEIIFINNSEQIDLGACIVC